MAAPGFGFSFGDFVQAIKILNDIRKALRDVGGAEDEFKHVLVDLQHLEILLDRLNCESWDNGGDAGHLNVVKGMALTCKVPLQEFLARIEKYKKMGSGKGVAFRARIGAEAAKIRWAVVMRNEVEKFGAVIMAKVVSINLLLQLNMVSTMSRIDNRTHATDSKMAAAQAEIKNMAMTQVELNGNVSRLIQICAGKRVGIEDFRRLIKVQHDDVRHLLKRIERKEDRGSEMILRSSRKIELQINRLESILRQLLRVFGGFPVALLKLLQQILRMDLEMYALLLQIQARLPNGPSLSTQDCIHFTDSLGRTKQLPYQWFKHWEVFESMLKCEFKGLPGEERVLYRRYHIVDAKRRGFIIDRFRWECSVFPGAQVAMSMIVTTEVVCGGHCPRSGCGQACDTPMSKTGHIICSKCNLKYFFFPSYASKEVDLDFIVDLDYLRSIKASKGDSYIGATLLDDPYPAGSSQGMSLSDLLSLCRAKYPVKEEIESFKMIHLSFGPGPWPRTGLFNDKRRMSLGQLEWEAFRAAQWSMSVVLDWLSKREFTSEFHLAFMELGLHGHAFFRLAEDTGGLRWKIAKNWYELKGSDQVYCSSLNSEPLDKELERLSHCVREIIDVKTDMLN